MPTIDKYELEILGSYEKEKLKSIATKSELAKLKAAARATAIKDRRVNMLDRDVTGRLSEQSDGAGTPSRGRASKPGDTSRN